MRICELETKVLLLIFAKVCLNPKQMKKRLDIFFSYSFSSYSIIKTISHGQRIRRRLSSWILTVEDSDISITVMQEEILSVRRLKVKDILGRLHLFKTCITDSTGTNEPLHLDKMDSMSSLCDLKIAVVIAKELVQKFVF